MAMIRILTKVLRRLWPVTTVVIEAKLDKSENNEYCVSDLHILGVVCIQGVSSRVQLYMTRLLKSGIDYCYVFEDSD